MNDPHDHDDAQWNCAQCLYHYTSIDAFLGMVKNRDGQGELRATHYAYLSDYSEIRHGLAVIGRSSERWVNSIRFGAQADETTWKIATYALRWLLDDFPLGRQLFVCCFSERGNLLSQWRAYTRPNKGLCLRFDRERLTAFMARHGFDGCRCEYLPEYQENQRYHFMSWMLKAAKEADESLSSASDPQQHYYEVFDKFTDPILRTAVGIKHDAFVEEAEFRFVSRNLSAKELIVRVKVREGASSLIPYPLSAALHREG